MKTGSIDFYNDQKGYGFIEQDDGGDDDEDVFFHVSDTVGSTPHEGDEVEFDVEQGDKGPRAVNVHRI